MWKNVVWEAAKRTVLEIGVDPYVRGGRSKSKLASIGAIQISGQGVVELVLLDDNFDGGIVRPWRDV